MPDIRLHLFGEASIQIGEEVIGPAASHLFALLLLLTLAPADGISRQELRELLFGRTEERAAAQRLRQLLYRLRQLGVELCDTAGGALRVANSVVEIVGAAGDDFGSLRALPHYRPRLPKAFLAWLEQTRERLEQRTQARLVRELREAHRRQDWAKVSELATVALAADPLNEEVATAGVESRAMLGRRDEALELADQFVREVEADEPAAVAMRRLRARIARTSLTKREATLRGREECLQLLADQWELAAEGGGRVCLVVGPAGMGKTRVAETFSAKVRLGGGRVVTYRCDRQVSQHPLALFSAILPELQMMPGSLGVSQENRATLERLNPSANVLTAELPGLSAVEARRAELQRALIDLVEAISAERRILLVIDDAHLLDDASCQVLQALANTENDAAILMAAFIRPRPQGAVQLTRVRRTFSYLLPPLTEQQSRDLLLELRNGRLQSEKHLRWVLSQAKGNPYYIYALASAPPEHGPLPAHIRSLARTLYFALSPDARTLLESCLLLGTLATLDRVERVAAIVESDLVNSLRELEELDLVHFEDGQLRGPHNILDDALRQLMSAGVSALLHARVARTLISECEHEGYRLPLVWAAVESLLSASEPQAAISLACQSARMAAELGEPRTGAELLAQIPRRALPPDCQRQLLDDLCQLAESANCQSILADALHDRMALALTMHEGADIRAAIKLKTYANARQNGLSVENALEDLTSIHYDINLPVTARTEAAKRIIAFSDAHLDSALADRTYAHICSTFDLSRRDDTSLLCAQLIYHTVFGDPQSALAIVQEVSKLVTSVDGVTTSLLGNAGLALIRLGYYAEARALAISMFERMISKGVLTSAELALSLITESELAVGDFDSASEWMARWEKIAERRQQYQSKFYAGYLSSKFSLLLYEHRYAEAEDFYRNHLPCDFLSDPRHRAIAQANAIILGHRRGHMNCSEATIREVRVLYERGRSLGGQDTCVEALWCAYMAQGGPDEASHLLHEYLTKYRRERGIPEWSLRTATATDPSWSMISRPALQQPQ